MILRNDQQRLYESIGMHGFVRVCKTDDALWVCDLPRHVQELDEVSQRLQEEGFICRLETSSRLWYIDWSPRRWAEVLQSFPCSKPAFPADDRYHAAYALCRLWISHPAQRTEKSLKLIRRVLKLTYEAEGRMLAAIPEMHDQAARQLRDGIPGAYDAGRILAAWIDERSR